MKYLATLLICCFAMFLPAQAQNKFPSDPAGVSRWMAYYYVEKDTAYIGDFLSWLQTSRNLDSNANFEPPAVGFLTAIFSDNPDRVSGWATSAPYSGRAKEVVERALWLSGHGDLISEVFHETPEYSAGKPVALLDMPLSSPSMFDMMWAAFMATGNTAYPARLIDVLDETTPLTGNKTMDMVYRGSAEWSLSSNVRQHELILRMVRREAASRTGAVQQKLKEMLTKFEAQRVSFPDCAGDFCAMLALISEDNLKEFDKPSDQGMYLTQLDEVKPGDHVAIKITFAGMDLADDLSADVTYDLKVVAPDGTLYSGSDQKDLEALKRKLPLRFSIFDNQAFIMIRFEPKDVRGTYKVFALVKDNIGKRSIALSRDIKLTD